MDPFPILKNSWNKNTWEIRKRDENRKNSPMPNVGHKGFIIPLYRFVRSKNIGLGNGQRKSGEFEEFVLEKRKYLRNEVKLCERATQRVLLYSNNFLHKRLKTDPSVSGLLCNRELKHATFLSHGRTPEVYCYPILLVLTLPHLYF